MSNTRAERCKFCHDCAICGRANDRARNVSGSYARGYFAVRNGMSVAELWRMIKRFLAFSLLLVTAACGGSASPTEPGSPSGATSGASISGTVSGTQSALTASGTNAIPGLVVTVAGTSISSGLDAAGRFTLNGVPGGDIQLQFSGPVSATITISNVQTSEKITLVISVSGSTVTVQAQTRTTGREEQLEGLVEAVSPAAGSLKVAGRDIVTDASTEIRHGNTPRVLGDLKVGYRVHVKGQTSGSTLLASSIFLQNTNIPGEDDADEDEGDEQDSSASIHGTLTAMSGSVPTLTLTVGGTTVRTSSSTDVKRRGDAQTLNELRIGMDLHVVGTRQSDGSLDARKIEISDDATGGEVEIAGAAGGVSGSCPALSFGINGYSIRTNASTTFEGITCAALKSGTRVTVKGISQGDNSVLATSVKAN